MKFAPTLFNFKWLYIKCANQKLIISRYVNLHSTRIYFTNIHVCWSYIFVLYIVCYINIFKQFSYVCWSYIFVLYVVCYINIFLSNFHIRGQQVMLIWKMEKHIGCINDYIYHLTTTKSRILVMKYSSWLKVH